MKAYDADKWVVVGYDSRLPILADLGHYCEPLPQLNDLEQAQLRRFDLPFYQLVSLYELAFEASSVVESPNGLAVERTYFLWGPGLFFSIGSDISQLIAWNKRLAALNAFTLDVNTALHYLQFRLNFQASFEKGYQLRFSLRIVESSDGDDQGHLEIVPLQFTQTSDYLHTQVLGQDKQGFWICSFQLDFDGSFMNDSVLQRRSLTGDANKDKEKLLPPLHLHRPGKRLLISEMPFMRRFATSETLLTGQQVQPGTWQAAEPQVRDQLVALLNLRYTLRLPGEDCQVQVLALPFYDQFDLYEVAEPANDEDLGSALVQRRFMVLWAKYDAALTGRVHLYSDLLRPLDLTDDSINELNAQLRQIGELHLTTETIPAYVRFYMGLVQRNGHFFNLINGLIVKAYLPSSASEVPTSDAPVTVHLPELVVHTTPKGGYWLPACVEYADKLYEFDVVVEATGDIKLYNARKHAEQLTGFERTRAYNIIGIESPINKPQTAPPTKTFADCIAPLVTEEAVPENQTVGLGNWEQVTLSIHHLLIKSLNRVCTPTLPRKKCVVRVHALPFYHLFDLYEITLPLDSVSASMAGRSTRCHYVLWIKPELLSLAGNIKPAELTDLIQPLSLGNGPIYELSETLRKVGGLHLTPDTVPVYVRFFFQLVRGPIEFYNLVNGLVLRLQDSGLADDADAVIRRIPAAQAEMLNGGVYRLPSYIGFKGSLFLADVLVQPDGRLQVQVSNAEQVGDILTPVSWFSSYQRLEYKPDCDKGGLQAHRYQFILQRMLQKRLLTATAAKEAWDAQMAGQSPLMIDTGQHWQFLSAEEFVKLAQKQEGIPLVNYYVTEAVRFTNQNLPHGRIELDGCFFAEGVQCDLTVENTEFKAARSFFQSGLSFGHGWQGFVHLQGCWAFPIPDNLSKTSRKPSLTMEGLSTASNIKCDMLWLSGELHLSDTACKIFQLTDSRIENDIKAERLTSREVQLSGHFAGLDLTQARVEGSVSLALVAAREDQSIHSMLTAPMLRCEKFSLRGVGGLAKLEWISLPYAHATHIEISNFAAMQLVDIQEAVIEGSLNILNADITGYASLNDLRAARISLEMLRLRKVSANALDGNLILDKAVAEFDLNIGSAYIDGHLSAKALTIGHRLILNDLRVGQDVKLSRSRFERGIRIGSWFAATSGQEQGVTIAGNLRLDQVQAGPVHLSPCRIGGQFYARQAHFESFRYLPGLAQHDTPEGLAGHQLVPSHVAGTVWLSGTTIAGNLDWVGVTVEGDSESDAEPVTRCGFVADMLHVQGNLRFYLEDEDLFRTVIETYREYSSVLDEASRHKYVRAKKTRPLFTFNLQQPSALPATPVHCRTRIGQSLGLEGLRLGGTLDLSGLWVDGQVNLNSCQIGGKLLLHHSRIGQLHLLRGMVQHDLLVKHAHIGNAGHLVADLGALTVHGLVALEQSHFECTLDLNGATIGKLFIEDVAIIGTLVMSRGTVQHDFDVNRLHVRVTCTNERYPTRKVDFTALSVGGQLRMRLTVLDCSLDLTDANLLRGLKAMGIESVAPALRIQGNLVLNSATSKEDVDLTGVQLEAADPLQRPSPSLEAVNLSIEGELKLADATGMTLLQIPGDINLARAKIHQLTLSDRTHQTGRQKKRFQAATGGVNLPEETIDIIRLDYAHIDLLKSFLPPPSPLSMNGLTVTQWDFGDKAHADVKAQQYIDFLKQENDVVQKPLYRAVEKQLYEQGDEQASDKVYTAMWKRDNETKFFVGKWLYAFFGYFTAVPNLTKFVLAVWIVFSAFVFWRPAHVVATDALLTAARGRMADATAWRHAKGGFSAADAAQYAQDSVLLRTRHPQNWGPKSFWLTLRYHLPMVPITAEADWVPSPKPSAMLLGGSPAGYAGVVSVFFWLVVPILAIIWTRRILKRARQT